MPMDLDVRKRLRIAAFLHAANMEHGLLHVFCRCLCAFALRGSLWSLICLGLGALLRADFIGHMYAFRAALFSKKLGLDYIRRPEHQPDCGMAVVAS
jgi:hypothetical protein